MKTTSKRQQTSCRHRSNIIQTLFEPAKCNKLTEKHFDVKQASLTHVVDIIQTSGTRCNQDLNPQRPHAEGVRSTARLELPAKSLRKYCETVGNVQELKA